MYIHTHTYYTHAHTHTNTHRRGRRAWNVRRKPVKPGREEDA